MGPHLTCLSPPSLAFQELLQGRGVVATIRWSRGLDGAAACGQLRLDAASR